MKPARTTDHNILTFSTSQTALAVLLILQAVMLAAMFTRTQPHPPLETPLFGMGPFLGTSIALAVAACMLGAQRTMSGRVVCALVMLLALITFGPQKWLDPAFGKIWPAVLLAQAAMITVGAACFCTWRTERASSH